MKSIIRFIILIIFFSKILSANAHIFVLHHFEDSKYKDSSISTDKLEENINYLVDNGYQIVSLKALVEKINKKEEVPDNWIVFTIDDGYKSFYNHGFQVFKKYNLPFTLFLYTEAIEKNYSEFMTWTEVIEVAKYGEVAIHSYAHPHLTQIDPISVLKDTQKAIGVFRNRLEQDPKYYSYPYGEFNKQSQDIIRAFGFNAIFHQNVGAVSKDSDITQLNRIPLIGDYNLSEILKIGFLEADWLYPRKYPKNSFLDKIKVKIPSNLKDIEVYISGKGWDKVKIEKTGILEYSFEKPLKLESDKVRIFIRTFDNLWSSTILIK